MARTGLGPGIPTRIRNSEDRATLLGMIVGHTIQEIADELQNAYMTVEKARGRLRDAFRVTSAASLVVRILTDKMINLTEFVPFFPGAYHEWELVVARLKSDPLTADELAFLVSQIAGYSARTETTWRSSKCPAIGKRIIKKAGLEQCARHRYMQVLAAAAFIGDLNWYQLSTEVTLQPGSQTVQLPGGIEVTITGPQGTTVTGRIGKSAARKTIINVTL